ncbi:unnamed protein product [Triticum turgidum subsp. durum]|uniref:GDSL esterase/lipase n=1 Tax=Triticum turgidum subsp. durum TaxID=4567 RepID=A0A9R1P5M0_TRITD|nr:unnamed protein product [Triticum turgidum subsp. durum]
MLAMRRSCRTALVAAVVVVALAMAPPGVCEKKGPLVTAVIVFGDSIMDPGNNNGLHTVVKANHAPYGKDFANHEPTGRFSNGLIPTDFMGKYLYARTSVCVILFCMCIPSMYACSPYILHALL